MHITLIIDCGAGPRSGCSDYPAPLRAHRRECAMQIFHHYRASHFSCTYIRYGMPIPIFFGEQKHTQQSRSKSRSTSTIAEFIYLIRCTSFIKWRWRSRPSVAGAPGLRTYSIAWMGRRCIAYLNKQASMPDNLIMMLVQWGPTNRRLFDNKRLNILCMFLFLFFFSLEIKGFSDEKKRPADPLQLNPGI